MKSYGTDSRLPQETPGGSTKSGVDSIKPPKICGFGGYDTPVLLMLWLLFSEAFWPVAAFYNTMLIVLGGGLCLLTSVVFMFFTRGTGRPWQLVSFLCLLASLAGLALGWCIRKEPHQYEVLTAAGHTNLVLLAPGHVVLLACAIDLALFAFIILLSWVLQCSGVRIIGSSLQGKDETRVAYYSRLINLMQFGCKCQGSLSDLSTLLSHDDVSYAEYVMSDLLDHRCYWSGEFMFDYIFHLANQHTFISCLFCHPAHPLEKHERVFLLTLVCLLLIFPVSAFSVVMGAGILRTILQLILVVIPRNVLKMLFIKFAVADSNKNFENRDEWRASGKSYWVFAHQEGTVKRNEAGQWRHIKSRSELEELDEKRWQEYLFYGVSTVFTAAVVVCCIFTVQSYTQDVKITLLSSIDGLLFAWLMEPIMFAVLPTTSYLVNKVCIGFFDRWIVEKNIKELDLTHDPQKLMNL